MRLTKEQETVCRVFSRRDKTGHVHCHDCPMVIDSRYAICLGTVTKEDARKYHDWNGSPYPALGEYEGELQGEKKVILIDMDKPESCMSCPFTDVDEDCILRKEETSGMETFNEMYQHCPLKEVQG